jgi:hypothetical protein
MTDYKTIIKKLSKKQREVFDQVCINNDRGHSRTTLKSLINKGLITQYTEVFLPNYYRYEFANYGVHMAWGEVCAEENLEDAEVIT